MPDKLTIAAYRCNTGGVQIVLAQLDENGRGMSYRLAGPKHHNAGTTELVSADISEADVTEIRVKLNSVIPPTYFELRNGDRESSTPPLILGRYTNLRAAFLHGEDDYGADTEQMRWFADTGDDDSDWTLTHVSVDSSGHESHVDTNWHVVQVPVAAEYDPDAEG